MPRSTIAIALLIAVVGFALVTACSSTPMPANASKVAPIDLQRFMGRWHVIAHVPYFAERGHDASADEYTLRPDGRVSVRYTYRASFSRPETISGFEARRSSPTPAIVNGRLGSSG